MKAVDPPVPFPVPATNDKVKPKLAPPDDALDLKRRHPARDEANVDIYTLYAREMGSVDLLTPEEEVTLARQMDGARKGLKQLYPSRVTVFSLDRASSLPRGLTPDHDAVIGFDEIEPEDIAILSQTLNITELGVQACYTLRRTFGKDWVRSFLGRGAAQRIRLRAMTMRWTSVTPS